MRALVVDDNYTNRRILHEMLLRWKMCPELAESGAGRNYHAPSRGQLRSAPYPLVIVDRHMPEMDGFMLLETVHTDPDLESTAIMMLTSGDQPEDCSPMPGTGRRGICRSSRFRSKSCSSLILRALGKMVKEEKSASAHTLAAIRAISFIDAFSRFAHPAGGRQRV